MRARVLLAPLVILTVTSCGGTGAPTQPSSTPVDAPSLPGGSYTLTITLSPTGDPVCTPQGVCSTITVCTGTPSDALSASVPVRIERAGAIAAVLPIESTSSFGMSLQIDGASVAGSARGAFVESGRSISLTGQTGPIASATGVLASTRAAGKFDGQLTVGGYSCSNNGHTWSLAPR